MATAKGNTSTYGIYAWVEYTVSSSATTTTLSVTKAQAYTATSGVGVNGELGTFSGTGQTTKTNNTWKMRSSATVNVFSAFSWSWKRGTSAQSKSISFRIKSTGTVDSTASFTVNVPALASYAVSYNANGGSGAPGGQTKYYNTTLTLSSTKPTRDGYTFLRWNTNSSGTGTNYSPGASYTGNAALALYAVWQQNTWPVSYNANGGDGTISNQTKVYGEALTLSSGEGISRNLYSLTKWNTEPDGSGDNHALGGTYSDNAALTLYAQWHLDYVSPSLFDFNVYRVGSAGSTTEQDDGEYIYGTVSYIAGYLEQYLESTITIYIDNVQVYSTTVSSSTGTITRTIGTYSKDTAHDIRVTISDAYGSATLTADIPTAFYPIDLYGSGTDVYMGIMHPHNQGQILTMPDAYIDGDIILMIDDTAAAGTVDGDLYDALDALGWI